MGLHLPMKLATVYNGRITGVLRLRYKTIAHRIADRKYPKSIFNGDCTGKMSSGRFASLLMNKNVGGAGLQTKSASQLPLRGNSRGASQRKFIPAVTRRGASRCSR
jgi:hypothetical protein